MVSKHGLPLIDDEAVEVLVGKFLQQAFLVTPNLSEASRLTGINVSDLSTMEKAAAAIEEREAKNVHVKAGKSMVLRSTYYGPAAKHEHFHPSESKPRMRMIQVAFCPPSSRRGWPTATIVSRPSPLQNNSFRQRSARGPVWAEATPRSTCTQ